MSPDAGTHLIVQPFELHLGPLTLTGCGIAMMPAFLVGQYVAQVELDQRGHAPESMGDALMGSVRQHWCHRWRPPVTQTALHAR